MIESESTEYVTLSIGRDIFNTLSMLKLFTLNGDKRKTWNRYFDKVIPILMKECDPLIFELALNRTEDRCSICGDPVAEGQPMCQMCYEWLREGVY